MRKLLPVLFFTLLLVLGTSLNAVAATFSVDMNGYNGTFTTVYISGTFNGWSQFDNALSDEDGDGIWSIVVDMPVGDDYKFQVDGWADQENFTSGDPCTMTFGDNGEFVNRIYNGDDEVCYTWAACSACGEGNTGGGNNGGGGTEVTNSILSVDMNGYNRAFTTVYISGTFNGWSDFANPLSDEDGDGIWSASVNIPVGGDYKFQVDGWADDEKFTDGDPCTQTFGDNGEFINRIYSGGAEVCFIWASCAPCGSTGGGNNGGGGSQNETYTTTFSVDMTNSNIAFQQVYLSGSFNAWSGEANPMSDADNDGIWTISLPLAEGMYEYKFTTDNWMHQEEFEVGSSCTLTTGEFTNRLIDVSANSEVCYNWNSCSICGDSTAEVLYTTTFEVDMNSYTNSFSTLYVSGSLNGWSGDSNPMSDTDGDGIWTAAITLPSGTYEYKFTIDDWAASEEFVPGESCTNTTDEFTNRIIDINSNSGVCFTWNSCSPCGSTGGGNNGTAGGGNGDGGNNGTAGGGNGDGGANGSTGGGNTALFSDYSWLSGIVDPNNCEGTSIQVYRSSGYVYLFVETANSSVLYNATGTLYCTGSPGYNCQELYSVDEVIENYSCGSGGNGNGGDTGGGNTGNTGGGNGDGGGNGTAGGGNTAIFSEYTWLSGIVDPNNCEGTTIQVYRSSGYIYLFVETATSSVLYNASGTLYCTGSPGYNCQELYAVDEVVENYSCGSSNNGGDTGSGNNGGGNAGGGNDGGANTTIFSDYAWLSDIVDPNNCSGTSIQVYRSSGYVYLFVETANSSVLYNASGTLYCTGSPGYNCQELYAVDEVVENYNCSGGQLSEDEILPAFKTTSNNQSITTALTTEFSVYPNPSNGLFFVELATNSDIDRTLTVLNIQGQIIQQQVLTATTAAQKIAFNLTNQAAGMYFVRVSSKEGNSVKRLIVK